MLLVLMFLLLKFWDFLKYKIDVEDKNFNDNITKKKNLGKQISVSLIITTKHQKSQNYHRSIVDQF